MPKRKAFAFPGSVPALPFLVVSCLMVFLLLPFSFSATAEPVASADKVQEFSDPARLASRSLLLDAVSDGNRIIAVGDRGHVLVSDDGGDLWTQVPVPTRSMLTAVAMPDSKNVWAVGHDAIILHSADGGRTWVRQYYAPDLESPLFDVWFENDKHGLAVGAYGLVLQTLDGGRTWDRLYPVEEENHWNGIAMGSDGTLYVAAEFGLVFRSLDGGKTWEAIRTPYEGSFFGLIPLPDGTLIVFGLRGNIYKSGDRGETWTKVPTGTTASLFGGTLIPDGTVVLAGRSGTVLVSRDNAGSFQVWNRPDRQGLSAVLHLGRDEVLLLGDDGINRDKDLLNKGSNPSTGRSDGS